MWRSLWRSIDRFSLQHFKHVVNELSSVKHINNQNRELVIDLLQAIVEIVTYGDRQDPLIFECFMECQVMAQFVRILKIARSGRIEAQLLQYLSIMIQNMDSEHAIFYCLSNDYINSIITHQYDFDRGDLAQYYISFLRAVSGKTNRDTLCLLVKVEQDVVVSFPLYCEALKFAHHSEKMIQTAVRALTLNLYNVSNDMVYKFVTTPPVSQYFSNTIHNFREQCSHLDALIDSSKEKLPDQRRKEVQLITDRIVDDLYYFKDVLSIDEPRLSEVVTENLLSLVVFPLLLPFSQLDQRDAWSLSAVTSLYIVSSIIQVVGGKVMVNSVAALLLHPYMKMSVKQHDNVDEPSDENSMIKCFSDVTINNCSDSESEAIGNVNKIYGHLKEYVTSCPQLVSCFEDENFCIKSGGIFASIFSDDHSLVLASLFLLLVLAESADLECWLASMIGLISTPDIAVNKTRAHKISASHVANDSIFSRLIPQISNMLFEVLASQPSLPAPIQWHIGWFLRKLLPFQELTLNDRDFQLFTSSYDQSSERLRTELHGCWFDHILDTLKSEWASCKTAIEKTSQSMDPFFTLEIALCEHISDGGTTSSSAWRRMLDAVKVFILHLQLKIFIFGGDLPENPLPELKRTVDNPGRTHISDLSTSSFGSEVSLGRRRFNFNISMGKTLDQRLNFCPSSLMTKFAFFTVSGIACRISFSDGGVRDIYLLPMAKGISGKLILAEKHPFRHQRGVVIAIAPLAGLSPKIDESHPTWLYLRIRELDPKLNSSKVRGQPSKIFSSLNDGRWVLGFPDAKACDTARTLILEETRKQRSFVESKLAHLLEKGSLGNLCDSQIIT
ncbi:hypothetical protein ACFE04_002393 [Oxalis oulophora]